VAAAAGDHHSLDETLANEAGFFFAAINSMLKLEESFFTVGVYVVGDRRAAERDGLFQYLFHCRVEL